MRPLHALLLSTALVASSAQAADITHQGASELEQKYNTYLPDDLAKAGLIKVRPGTQDYEVTFDPAVLLKNVDPKTFSISGLKPFLSLMRPLENGLWSFTQTTDLDIKGHVTAGPDKTDFSYKIDAMKAEGTVDPELLYFRSAEMTANGIFMTTTSPQQSLEARFGSMKTTFDAKSPTSGRVDIRANTDMNGFFETVIDPTKMRVDISADSINTDVAFNGLAYKPLQEAVLFLLDRAKNKAFKPQDEARIKELALANIPMFETLLESIELANLNVKTPTGTFGAEAVRYTISSNGLRDSAEFGFGFAVDKPVIPLGLVPEVYRAALPETVSSRITLGKLNLASGIHYFVDNANFTAEKPLTDAQSAELSAIILPSGALTIRYDDVSARSSIYDVSLSGTTTMYPEQKGVQDTDITVYAKDFDKTIAYLQQNAKTVPEFGQAAFMLLMVKGFAKQAPDGRQMWNVAVNEAGKVKINGQDLPFQK